MYVCLNGTILPAAQAHVSVFDHGFLYGAGLFETMRTVGGRPMFWEAHERRLRESAQALGIREFPDAATLEQQMVATVRANSLEEAYVRLTITRGEGALGPSGTSCETPTVVIYAKPLVLPPAHVYEQGRDLMLLATRRSSPETSIRVKSLNYLNSLLAYAELEARGGREGVQLTSDGAVAEGAVSNLFFVVDQELWTPSLDTGILPGITRDWVIQTAKRHGIPVREHCFTVSDLQQATEAFTTSSVVGILPAVSIEQRPIGSGMPGVLTRLLMREWAELLV